MLVVPLAGGEVGIFFLLKSSCQRQGLHGRYGAGKGGLHGKEPFYHPIGVVLRCGCVEPCGFGSWAPWSGLRRSVAAPQCVGLVALRHAAQRALVLRAGLRFRRPCLDSRVGAHRHRVTICRSGDSLPFPVVFVGGSALGLSSYELHLQAVAVTQYCALGFASLRPRGDVARGFQDADCARGRVGSHAVCGCRGIGAGGHDRHRERYDPSWAAYGVRGVGPALVLVPAGFFGAVVRFDVQVFRQSVRGRLVVCGV